ncbi:MAG: CxxxxCH/CxxCH domain-containing protein, partial [Deltaproteobacteria bacterium]|nr:CxxxxCH/CxxCH domain-containing protein [Deltaproteobacteria bacterium]
MKTDQHDKRQNRFSVRRYRRLATGYLPPILFAVGCSTSPLGTGGPATADVTCTSCHGSGENAAPPPAVGGSNGTSDPGVGAHRTHVLGGPLKKRFDCDACHTKPAAVSAPGHVNGVVDLTWGVLARAGGAMPVFDETTATCSSVYCHGATLPGGTNTTPVWTTVDGTQAKCGACHGAPPPAPHPPNKSCEMCHPDPEDGGKHVNGVLDKKFDELTCTICHGDPSTGDAAPPVGPGGETETTEAAVGAHRNHLGPSDWHRSVGCSDCHAVPTSTSHADGKTDFAFGDTARADGAAPQYDASKATCSSVYCHGATLFGAKTGGTVKREPVWTQVDGTFNACGASCHTNPPGGDHLANEACDLCHGQVIGLNGRWVNPALHVDGKVDVKSMVCNGCHGSADNNAPPVSTSGSSDTGDVTVGAHQSHVKDGALRAALDCTECHVVPAAWDAAGHIDTPPAEVTWGTLAVSDGANPGWDHNSATCSAVYCHGATLSGGTRTEPVWTTVDGTFDECGACHGVPPPWPHPYKSTCHDCHPGTVAADGTIDVAGGKHIDGELEVDYSSMTCSSCHGGVENAA